ncbi:hypothetical protein [Devosia submarina]|uniref:aldose epimerase family protein n=1 Tax=Devosia submarina TaxID=1173082 RepID=UPI000D38C0CC|nr:hypothetical protein [Devosia submarina]
MDKLALSAGPYRAIATLDGGGLLEFSREEKASSRHILRPAGQYPSSPLDRAMIVMAPWCNRIGGGGFSSGGRFHLIAPNVSGFPMPLHGTAFQSRWELIEQQENRLSLTLDASEPGPFRYSARLTYRLSPRRLLVELRVTNTGAELPFGIGLHPSFVSDEETCLQFSSARQVMSDAAGLPTHIGPLVDDFVQPRTLPAERIDNTFIGWDGKALLRQRDNNLRLWSSAPFLHVFSPTRSAGFCCLEPSTALPNGPNFALSRSINLGFSEITSIKMAIFSEHAADDC